MGNKSLCKWEKNDRFENLDDYRKIVGKADFMCESCGRVASKKKWLCDPYRLKPAGKKRAAKSAKK
jgi:hypothetical protein